MGDQQTRRAVDRRRVLVGLGAAGAAAAATSVVAAPAGAAAVRSPGLPVLRAKEKDWAAALAKTPQVQLEPGATYVLPATVELPDDCFIAGNGATVTVTDDSHGALAVTRKRDVTITDVRFVGRDESPVNQPSEFRHVGVRIDRSTNVRITGCDFTNWRGAGVVATGSTRDDYFAYRVKLVANAFYGCYFGTSMADRSEYSIATDNSFAYCRLAIWNSSGNWSINDNDVVGCRGAYYSIAATSPYGDLASDNWGHGSVVGNTFNHSNGGVRDGWTSHTAFPIGDTVRDPGAGVVIERVLPPTFTGNTLWYTDVRAIDLAGTPWLLSGCTFSNLSITGVGDVAVHLVGTQANGRDNLPRLIGNVKDLLAGLG